MKSAAEINCCTPPALGEEGTPLLSESFLRIVFVWHGFCCEGLKNVLQNTNFCVRAESLSVNAGVSLQ